MKLTERQRRFADEYIISGNAYRSCIDAGYSEKYAKTNSHIMLENTRIKQYIDERLNLIKSNEIAEQKEILAYLTKVMRGEETDTEVIPVAVGKGVQDIKEIEKRTDTNARIKSAELLGKRYALWTDKYDINASSVVFVDGIMNKETEKYIEENHPNSTVLVDDIPMED